MNEWKEILKAHCGTEKIGPFEDSEEITDFMNVSPKMKMAKLERQILKEIKKEGGALGMKNLKQFGKETEIKRALSKLEKEGKVFMHKDGDIYTHKPSSKKRGPFTA